MSTPLLNSEFRKAETSCAHRSPWPRRCSVEKCPAGQRQHPRVGWVRACFIPSTLEVNKAAFFPWQQPSWAPLGRPRVQRTAVSVRGQHSGARRRTGPEPYQIIFASEAARFQRPAARAICCSVSPGEASPPLGLPFCSQTELSLRPGSPSLLPRVAARVPE